MDMILSFIPPFVGRRKLGPRCSNIKVKPFIIIFIIGFADYHFNPFYFWLSTLLRERKKVNPFIYLCFSLIISELSGLLLFSCVVIFNS